MALKEIQVDGESVLVEVTDLRVQGADGGEEADGFEYTSTDTDTDTNKDKDTDMGKRIRVLMGALTAPVRATMEGAGAAEWTMEINVGFKGESGLPFIAKGEANAAVKVTAKWAKGS